MITQVFLRAMVAHGTRTFMYPPRLAPMWQQSGTLIFCSCHGIAGFLVDELQIWIWRHFLEVLSDMTLIFIFKKEYIIFVKYVF